MPYRVEVSAEAEIDLRYLRPADQKALRRALPRYLMHEPAAASGKRRPLDPNPYGAGWELRLGELRALYAVAEAVQAVTVLRIGQKMRERLYLRGVPVEMRLP